MALSASLPAFGPLTTAVLTLKWDGGVQASAEEPILEQARALDRFLSSIEKRAFRMARIALRHDDDALDSVQDAMLQLARRYGRRPSEEWRPLFYRILQNRIRDCQRRRRVRARIMAWLPGSKLHDDAGADEYAAVPDRAPLPPEQLAADQAMQALEKSLAGLPGRQQEAFMLRVFEGMDVAQTAAAMGCSEGSVKTHYSRAVHTLRERLGSCVVSNEMEREDLERRAQALFEDSVERLDARTRSKLTQARNLALDEVKKGAAQRRWIWAPAGGFALAAVIAVGIVFWPGRTPQPGAAALEDLEIVADSENLELLQDVEFYAWLDEQ